MFSGIIEALEPIIESKPMDQSLQISIRRPSFFDDIKKGDSIAVNGICLTLSDFNETKMTFTLGLETLSIIGNEIKPWLNRLSNLERSLAFGARVHGHFVTGHQETLLTVIKSEPQGDNWLLTVEIPNEFQRYCWKKGSVTLNGVSLTINSLLSNQLEVCLIPETQNRTNLTLYRPGDKMGFEPDSFAKAIVHALDHGSFGPGGKNV